MVAFNDGIIPFGSRILSFSSSAGVAYDLTGSAAKTYIAEAYETTRPTIAIRRSNEVGEPSAAVYIPDWITGTATLQLLNSASSYPLRGDRFATTSTVGNPTGSVLEHFVVTQVGTPESNTTERKVGIQFSNVINV
jgi:hypothetical protein